MDTSSLLSHLEESSITQNGTYSLISLNIDNYSTLTPKTTSKNTFTPKKKNNNCASKIFSLLFFFILYFPMGVNVFSKEYKNKLLKLIFMGNSGLYLMCILWLLSAAYASLFTKKYKGEVTHLKKKKIFAYFMASFLTLLQS